MRRILATLLTVGLALPLMGIKAASERVRFDFKPPDGLVFIQTLRTTKTRRTGEAHPEVEVSENRSRVTIRRTAEGWDYEMEPLGIWMTRNGQPARSPLMETLQQARIVYKLDPEGQLKRVVGYGEMMDKLRGAMPQQAFEALARLVNEDALVNRDTAEWNARIGNFIGLSAKFGSGWSTTDQFPLPTGGNAKFFNVTRIAPSLTPRDGRDLIKIEFSFNSDAAEAAKFLGKPLADIARSQRETATPGNVTDVQIEGDGEQMIDPETLLVYSERMARGLTLKSEVAGKGTVETYLEERREYSFDYAPHAPEAVQPAVSGK